MADAMSIQAEYYRRTAAQYDDMHVRPDDEHGFALAFLLSTIQFMGIKSVLDVGCGTGRAALTIKQAFPDIRVCGVEPSAHLRAIGHAKGLGPTELIDGDGQRLPFADGSFDIVCEFAALHHMPEPGKTVAEMLRVARVGIFISDSNNFGQGTWLMRSIKQMINAVGLWKAANFLKTKGKGYIVTEGDGLSYSYSAFQDYAKIRAACSRVHILNTVDAGINPYRSAQHIALLGLK